MRKGSALPLSTVVGASSGDSGFSGDRGLQHVDGVVSGQMPKTSLPIVAGGDPQILSVPIAVGIRGINAAQFSIALKLRDPRAYPTFFLAKQYQFEKQSWTGDQFQ